MKVVFILLIAWCEFQENTTIVTENKTDIRSDLSPTSGPKKNTFFSSIQKINTESGTSISMIPKVSDYSGICPNSNCNNNVTEYRNNKYPPSKGCYCDKLCIGLRDCCENSRFYDEKEQRQPQTLDCVFNLREEPDGYYVNRICSSSWEDSDFVINCAKSRYMDLNIADLRLSVPVTSLSTGVTYGNIFCAICNNDDNIIAWNTEIIDFCVAGKYKMQLKNASDLKFNRKHWYVMKNQVEYVCELSLSKPKKVELNKCLQKDVFESLIVKSCWKNWTDPTVSRQCQGAYALVYLNIPNKTSTIYKNKFCAYCNGLNDSQLFCRPSSFAMALKGLPISKGNAISVTFDVNIDLSDTDFCGKAFIKGKHRTASEQRFCPMVAEETRNLLTRSPINDTTENSFFESTQKIDTESGTSIPMIPKLSDYSGICPNSKCRDNVTDQRNEHPPLRGCYCDKLCIGLRDCCEDSIFYDEEEQRKSPTLDCHFNLEELDGYYVDRGCPRSWKNLKIVEKCVISRHKGLNTADFQLVVPVTSLSTGVTYGNIYCAICNDDDNLFGWDIEIVDFCFAGNNRGRLEKVSDLKFNGNQWYIMQNQTEYFCEAIMISKPKEIKLNQCRFHEELKSFIIKSCWENWTDPTVSRQCQGAYALVYLNIPDETSTIYKNKFCAYCNGLNDSQLFCRPSSIRKTLKPLRPTFSKEFSIIFDFNIDLSNDTDFCGKALVKGKHIFALEKRLCPTITEQNELSEKTNNWFFTSYTPIALLISLILLICHLLVFTVVKKLHTIGGKNLASFCLALILAYCNFLAGNYLEGKACFVVSIVTYYSFLSAFSWMFTISFDIWKTFRYLAKKLRSPRNSKYKFLLYSICSWTIPAVFVSTAVYFDLSQSYPTLAPRFGENGCWFHNGYSLLLLFVAPVSIIIVINFVLFLHVSFVLRNNQCESSNQEAYVDFKLYARIGFLTGFTWITGFIAGYFQNIVIWYIFIILNTGQGLLIFVCFTCKKEFISIALHKIGLSCCLTASCKKLVNPTVTTKVKTKKKLVTGVEKNC